MRHYCNVFVMYKIKGPTSNPPSRFTAFAIMNCYKNTVCAAAFCLATLCSVSLAYSNPKAVNCSVQDTEDTNSQTSSLWPGGVVKYELDHSTLSKKDVQIIRTAQNEIESKTCIVFQRRLQQDTSYTVIGTENSICGDATVCRRQNVSYTRFGGQCRNKKTMIHELGHTLCLPHETLESPACQSNKTSYVRKTEHLYDFWSQMASLNADKKNWYHQFTPMKTQQHDVTGFSVLDVDKINSLYNCLGCYSHRWKFVKDLKEDDNKYMIRFGRTTSGTPLYACRGYVNGELVVGKYRADEQKCYLGWAGMVFVQTQWAQVYLDSAWVKGQVPTKGAYNSSEDLGDEHFVKVINGRFYNKAGNRMNATEIEYMKETLIPAGTKNEENTVVTGYLAVGEVGPFVNNTYEKSVGKIWEHDLIKVMDPQSGQGAHFPIDGKEKILRTFKIFRCNDIRDVTKTSI